MTDVESTIAHYQTMIDTVMQPQLEQRRAQLREMQELLRANAALLETLQMMHSRAQESIQVNHEIAAQVYVRSEMYGCWWFSTFLSHLCSHRVQRR